MHWFVRRGDILTPLPVACIPQHGTRLATKRSWSGGGSSDLCLGRILASVVIAAGRGGAAFVAALDASAEAVELGTLCGSAAQQKACAGSCARAALELRGTMSAHRRGTREGHAQHHPNRASDRNRDGWFMGQAALQEVSLASAEPRKGHSVSVLPSPLSTRCSVFAEEPSGNAQHSRLFYRLGWNILEHGVEVRFTAKPTSIFYVDWPTRGPGSPREPQTHLPPI